MLSPNIRRQSFAAGRKFRSRNDLTTTAGRRARSDPPTAIAIGDSSLPWGSLPKPNFGVIRASTGLSSSQVDSLIRGYLPSDKVETTKERARVVKSLHQLMRQKEMDKLRDKLTELRSGIIPLDETLFVTMVFGHLQLRGGLIEADSVVGEMNNSDFIHPALKSMVSSFVNSLKALYQFDAFPNRTAIVKSFIPFFEIAMQIRKMRILAFRVAMSDRMKNGEVLFPESDDKSATQDTELDNFIRETLNSTLDEDDLT